MNKKNIGLAVSLVLLLLLSGVIIYLKWQPQNNEVLPLINNLTMQLTSPIFNEGENIPSRYTCDGKNINPPLNIIDAPEGVESFVLIVDDPDATHGDWVHWLVWNIAPTTVSIGENSVPQGAVQGMTDFKNQSYGGPCPPASPERKRGEPSGTHRYQFKLYAIDTMLDIDETSTKKDVEKTMENHIISTAMLIGLYARL